MIFIIKVHTEVLHSEYGICSLNFTILKEIPIFLCNGCNDIYHFIITGLAEEFKAQISYLRENTEKYITFSVPIKKKLQVLIKNQEIEPKTITYKLEFIDSVSLL